MSATARLKAIDFYRKIPRDLTEATLSGAGLSIVAAIFMILLFGMELRSYLTISTRTDVIVDQSKDGDLLRVNFNFSFPSLSCEFASVDVNDVLGTARFNLTKTVHKYPIDPHNNVIGPEHHAEGVPTPKKHGDHPDDPASRQLMENTSEEHGSLILTDSNFDERAHEFPVLLVNFYAPWCPWSRQLEPAWERAANMLVGMYPPDTDGRLRFAKVDCTVYQALCKKHHIQAFPSIRVFRKGNDLRETQGHHEHHSYYGERDHESLVKFAWSLVPRGVIEGEERRGLEEKDPTDTQDHEGVLRKAPQTAGCNIEGFVLVKKVPGNLMVSASSGAHSFDASTMNLTHWVHHLSFGRPLTKRRQDAVDRLLPHHFHIAEDTPGRITHMLFKSLHDNVTHDHYLQVVMTEVKPLGYKERLKNHQLRQTLQSYDYTAHSNIVQSPQVPVARFHYELSPMQVMITEQRRSFSHFITNVCAIIGGVFTVAGIIDAMLHTTISMVKKVNLGKQY